MLLLSVDEGVPDPVHRIEIWLDDAHWWLTQKDGQLQIADIKLTNFRLAVQAYHPTDIPVNPQTARYYTYYPSTLIHLCMYVT